MSNSEFGNISFDLPKNQSNVIKVIGVGGGGSNAINHMFKQGIKGVDFIVCNTDSQALENSAVPNKIQLGLYLTEGLGAGANPDIGHQSAIESIADIEKMLDQNTKMVFITAGMGGGTGTGAAPVIAQLAKERDILTVGIVTLPFLFEGKVRQEQARVGIEKLRKQVDSLIVINNNKLREVYGNLGFTAGFSKADEVLATASRGIAEVITHHYTQNIDLRDAKTVLANSGTAIMGSAKAEGENRAKEAIKSALDSPLLNDNKITGAKNVLLLIVSGSNEITLDEIGEINDYIQNEAGNNANIIMGVGEDSSLGDAVAVTIIATGFNAEQQNGIVNSEPKKIIHALDGEQSNVYNLSKSSITAFDFNQGNNNENKLEENIAKVSEVQTIPTVESQDLVLMSERLKNIEVLFEIVSPKKELDVFVNSEIPIKNQIQTPSLFDLPVIESIQEVNQVENVKMPTKSSWSEVNDIKVNEPVTNVSEEVIKYSLEEYMEVENLLISSKPSKGNNEEVPSEMNITMKSAEVPFFEEVDSQDKSPMEMTIEDTLKLRAEERRRKLKEFNYKFNSSSSMIEEYEKEPAYKRLGVDISTKQLNNTVSRISVSTDSNNDLQLRSNNSFLHDNVD